jgi:hypothetical protein
MRGRQVSIASALADALSRGPGAGAASAACAAAFAEAVGPRLARACEVRGLFPDGRLLVVAANADWARELTALSDTVCEKVNARLKRPAATRLAVLVK